jgi:hypothetical protein
MHHKYQELSHICHENEKRKQNVKLRALRSEKHQQDKVSPRQNNHHFTLKLWGLHLYEVHAQFHFQMNGLHDY